MRLYRSKRAWSLATVALVLALLIGSAPSLLAQLASSSFESSDGNLVVTTAGNKDWQNAPNLASGAEKASGQSDDSFGGGAKEDIPNPRVVSGSIPNNKSDLTRFYVANDTVTLAGNQVKNFLYLAWERANTLGSANIDFEFNQSVITETNGITLKRTAGDLLVTYDFEQGGSSPVLGLLTWITDTDSVAQCFSANSVPCWGSHVDLSQAGFADGAINPGPVLDPLTGATQAQLTFGEAAVDLNAAGVVQPNQCKHFGRAYVKSRSSTSFPAELKDFIAPIPVNIDTCGSLKILKHDDLNPGNLLGGATFNISPNPATGTGSINVTDNGAGDLDSTAGVIKIAPALPIQYTVTEVTPPTGWIGSSGSVQVTVGAAGEVTAGPFVNTLGSIAWEKRDSGGNLLGGATFSISPNPFSCRSGSLSSFRDGDAVDKDADAGQLKLERVCVGATYTITETVAPTGYGIDLNASRTVTPTAAAPNQVIGTMGSDDPILDFHNRLGSIAFEKRDADGNLLGGATFSISPNPFSCWGGSLSSFTDGDAVDKDADAGQLKLERVCIGATYTITETAAPAGYGIDQNPSRTATPTSAAPNQAIGTMGIDDPTLDFHNRPLLKLLVQVVRQDDNTVVSGVAYSLSSMSSNPCTFAGEANQTQTVSPTEVTGEWSNLRWNCMASGPGYQLTVKTPAP